LHANSRDEVYLRIGDQSRRLSFDERMQMAYDRGEASWESALMPEFPLDELDADTLERYRTAIGTSLTAHQLLLARRLADQKDDRLILNRAGVRTGLLRKHSCSLQRIPVCGFRAPTFGSCVTKG
jgi:ATP-dependent DNA helicase RecG